MQQRDKRIGNIYTVLIQKLPDDIENTETKWMNKITGGEVDIDQTLDIASKVFLSTKLMAQQYKTTYELYYTPEKLFKWGRRENDLCPRSYEGPADSIHMFFACSKLKDLKLKIESFLTQALKKNVKISVEMMMFGHDCRMQWEDIAQRDLVFITMAATRLLIATFRKDQEPPQFHQWLYKILSIGQQEVALYRCKGNKSRRYGLKLWGPLVAWMDSKR